MIKIFPLMGIDNVNPDDELFSNGSNGTATYLTDAVNVDILPSGKLSLLKDSVLATTTPYQDMWQSSLHGDVFGRLDNQWVKINPSDWSHEILCMIGDKAIHHIVLNNSVVVAGEQGVWQYDGKQAMPLTIPTPPMPMMSAIDGNMDKGTYLVAIAWLQGEKQSGVSEIAKIKLEGDLSAVVNLPLCFDKIVTGVRVFVSHADGSNLYRLGDYPIDTAEVILTHDTHGQADFVNFSPMPTGDYLDYWKGRLISAKSNVIRFSQPLAYHVHDERFDFVLLPQRITFLKVVEGGIWVGQRDHILFLTGSNPKDMALIHKGQCYPVRNSAIMLPPETVGEMAQGTDSVAWLSNKGYMIGLASGEVVEPQSKRLKDITANSGYPVRLNNRVITIVS